jgi:carbon storage regulator CsrA
VLVLTRKKGQQIRIGDDIIVTVSSVQGGSVRLGIEARPEIKILRGELTRFVESPAAEIPDQSRAALLQRGGLAVVDEVAGVPVVPLARPR